MTYEEELYWLYREVKEGVEGAREKLAHFIGAPCTAPEPPSWGRQPAKNYSTSRGKGSYYQQDIQ